MPPRPARLASASMTAICASAAVCSRTFTNRRFVAPRAKRSRSPAATSSAACAAPLAKLHALLRCVELRVGVTYAREDLVACVAALVLEGAQLRLGRLQLAAGLPQPERHGQRDTHFHDGWSERVLRARVGSARRHRATPHRKRPAWVRAGFRRAIVESLPSARMRLQPEARADSRAPFALPGQVRGVGATGFDEGSLGGSLSRAASTGVPLVSRK